MKSVKNSNFVKHFFYCFVWRIYLPLALFNVECWGFLRIIFPGVLKGHIHALLLHDPSPHVTHSGSGALFIHLSIYIPIISIYLSIYIYLSISIYLSVLNYKNCLSLFENLSIFYKYISIYLSSVPVDWSEM